MGDTAPVTSRRTDGWTPARWFMLVAAVWHIPLGIIGLIYDRTFPIGSGAASRAHSEHIFGIFETNGWHSTAAVLVGVIALYFTLYPARAREGALAIGWFHVGVVLALTFWSPDTFWLASNAADQVIHASSAVGGIATGYLTPAGPTRARGGAGHPLPG